MTLAQLAGPRPFITDGGLETWLVFQAGVELVDFAAFPLIDSEEGRRILGDYLANYLDIAERLGVGLVADTPTWRANLDWGARLGYDDAALAALNRRSIEFVRGATAERPGVPTVVDGVIGPRGDGYAVGATMSAAEATAYHGLQTRAFADAGADMVSAITMTYADEAIGVARAATAAGLPVVVSFTVETDGSLPSGQSLAAAISEVDDATDGAPEHFMVNCAHPTHFAGLLTSDAAWTKRVKGIRANASRLSHDELDAATELDRGDPTELAQLYDDLRSSLELWVVGGCCGTDHEHVAAIAETLVGRAALGTTS